MCSKEDGFDASDSDDGARPLQVSVGLISFTIFFMLLLLREARASGGTATMLRPAFAGEERKRERESEGESSQEGKTAVRYNKASRALTSVDRLA